MSFTAHLSIVTAAFKSIDDLRLHLSELNRRVDAEARDAVLADLKALRENAAGLVLLSGRNAALQDLAKKIEPSPAAIEKHTSLLISIADRWQANKQAATELVATASRTLEQFVSTAQESGKEISQRSATMSRSAMIAGTVLAIIGGLMLIEILRGSLKRITQTMMRLADGDLNVPIGDGKRGDEIGDMIRSVTVFCDHALEKTRLEELAEANRARDELEQARRAAEQARIEAEQSEALTALSDMLSKLADGDLAAMMSEDLAADYVAIARTYNHAIDGLRLTLAEVRNTTYEIAEGSTNLSGAADDLPAARNSWRRPSRRVRGCWVNSPPACERRPKTPVRRRFRSPRRAAGRSTRGCCRQGDRRHGRHQPVVRKSQQHHRRDRRDCFPDQSPRAQCGFGSGPGRRGGQRFCRRRPGGA